MISQSTIQFLISLKENNHREWFLEHKKEYERAKSDFENLIKDIIFKIGDFDTEINHLEPKECIFRINRDVRFSADKSPYKTNFGAYMARGGRKGPFAGYYLHIEPGTSFVGGGIYMPLPENLKKIREHIFDHFDSFQNIITNPSFKKQFNSIEGDRLKTAPKGFPSDEKYGILKNKDFYTSRQFTDTEILSSNFQKEIIEVFRTMKPFNDFLNEAIA